MKYFAVQINTTKEENYITKIKKYLEHRPEEQHFYFPKRKLSIRKQGKTTDSIMPIFPGYIFLETESVDTELFGIMRTTAGFTRFLKSNKDITPLTGKDLAVLQHFLQFGSVAESSKVYFDENHKIIVKSGPLKGLEGLIVKVDKRKHRAKVRIEFAEQSIMLDLSFEVMEEKDDSSD